MPQILNTKDIGSITVYGDALTGGYDGTKAQLFSLIAGIANGAMLINVGYKTVTLSASAWDDGTYDLTASLPTNRYSILAVDMDCDNVSGLQIAAWYDADISFSDGNILTAHKNVPEIDIPVVVVYQAMTATIAEVPTAASTMYYTGSSVSPVWNNYNPDELEIGGETSATDIGTYTVTFTPKAGYKWWDDTRDAKTATWEIASLPSWSTGTDEEIASILEAHYAGTLNIYDYWNVGDERQITISAIEASSALGTVAQPSQTITMVLLNKGGKTLSDGTECAFVVGMKRLLENADTVSGVRAAYVSSLMWSAAAMHSWCNAQFKNALPESTVAFFKEHKNKFLRGNGYSTVYETTDYFTLPSIYEILGDGSASSPYAGEGIQFEYYKTESNRKKSWRNSYWTRSRSYSTTSWGYITTAGELSYQSPANTVTDYISVQGVI